MLTWSLNQGHADLNHENNKHSILSETVQATPIKFAVKIVRLKVSRNLPRSDDLALHPRSQSWRVGRLMHRIYDHARVDDLDLDARSQWVSKGKKYALNYLDN